MRGRNWDKSEKGKRLRTTLPTAGETNFCAPKKDPAGLLLTWHERVRMRDALVSALRLVLRNNLDRQWAPIGRCTAKFT
jgi:hypothetical protein